jgi:hypothetical protein
MTWRGRRRREVLRAGFWGVLASLFDGAAAAPTAPGDDLTAWLRHARSAAVVGREYLKIAPREADAAVLRHLIGDDRAMAAATGRASARAMREHLRTRARQDFEDGRIVTLQGWILSVTEARLCALVALERPSA